MATQGDKQSNRYVNDLRRFSFAQGEVKQVRGKFLPFTVAGIFLIVAGIHGNLSLQVAPQDVFMLVCASAIGGYMALNIGANDVANNMGPAVGSKVLSIAAAWVITVPASALLSASLFYVLHLP